MRIKGDGAELNIKHTLDGINRLEYEYEIPVSDAREILDRVALRPLIEKTRHHVVRGDHLWEIDEFYGENAGLVLAEIELGDPDEPFVSMLPAEFSARDLLLVPAILKISF